MKKEVKLSDLDKGVVRHQVLPEGFIERIKVFKTTLGDTDTVSIEETIDNFKRDVNPESELIIWERIASTFGLYISHNPTKNPEVMKEIYAILVQTSMGMNDWSNIKHLTKEQINHLVLNYTGV